MIKGFARLVGRVPFILTLEHTLERFWNAPRSEYSIITEETATSTQVRASSSTIRRQLIWASVFPLTAFGLLSILLITAALQSLTLNQAMQRDTALAQVAAAQVDARLSQVVLALQDAARDPAFTPQTSSYDRLAADLSPLHVELIELDPGGAVTGASTSAASWRGQTLPLPQVLSQTWISANVELGQGSNGFLRVSVPIVRRNQTAGFLEALLPTGDSTWLAGIQLPATAGSRMSFFDRSGNLVAQTGALDGAPREWPFTGDTRANSSMLENPSTGDQVVYSYAPLSHSGLAIALEEPWTALYAAAANYAWVMAALLVIGTILSVVMLSASLGRVIRPLGNLSRLADSLGPGSTFHPLPEEGPDELRSLTHAFNQMVIRLAEQQAALRQYAEKALLSQEEERQRISHELHDETVQELVGLLQRVDLCRTEMEQSPDLARRRLDELKTLAEQALNDLRRISNALRPSILQDLGLPSAIQSLCDDLERQMPELTCEFALLGEERRLAPDLELAVFRVTQEALSNIRRHSDQVSEVDVILQFEPDCVRASIQDDGQGFPVPDVRTLVANGHLGVAGMYERARLFGGELSIVSDPETGTTVTLCMPGEMGITMSPAENGGPYAG
jgi:two-component system, NarL family, sensor histidine kinase UhpB